jgi:hypothetical protein
MVFELLLGQFVCHSGRQMAHIQLGKYAKGVRQ